eukprot:gene19529-26205_t
MSPISWVRGFLLARDALLADDPRTVIDQWTGMVQAVFIVYWLARWSRVWLLVLNVLTYRASEDIQTVHRLVDTANKEAGEGRAWMFGNTELWHRRQVPRFVILWKGRLPFLIINAITSHMGYNTHNELTAHVVGLRGSAPVVQEPEADDKNSQEGVITVLEPGSNDVGGSYLEEFPQTAIDSDVPAQAAQAAMTAAAVMEDAYIKSKCKAKVFILKGSPGCGKSTAVRALALRLNATLYGLYNPTRTGECIWTLLAKYPSKNAPLLIAFEEFDVPLANLMRGHVTETDKLRRDATNKSSWNNHLDRFKRNKNVVLVMTTNRSDRELLDDVCLGDESLLRPGRINMRIEFDDPAAMAEGSESASFAGDSVQSLAPRAAPRAAATPTAAKPRWR